MEVKIFEIRDKGTMIPALAMQFGSRNEAERWLLGNAGYGLTATEQKQYVLLAKLSDGEGSTDPYGWPSGTRTMNVAHVHIRKHWESLVSGDVICVEFLCGEREAPKLSDRRPL